jgi:SOS-response transcriptional repressor LexA
VTSSRPPTDRQREVLDFIRGYIADHARPPTVREISARLGITSTNGTVCHVRALVKKGWLRPDRPAPGRDTAYVPARGEVVVRAEGDGVRVGVTAPATFTRAEWEGWLRARLRELKVAA